MNCFEGNLYTTGIASLYMLVSRRSPFSLCPPPPPSKEKKPKENNKLNLEYSFIKCIHNIFKRTLLCNTFSVYEKKRRGRDWPASGSAPVYSYRKYLCIQDREALVAILMVQTPHFQNAQHFLLINFEISIIQGWGALTQLHI